MSVSHSTSGYDSRRRGTEFLLLFLKGLKKKMYCKKKEMIYLVSSKSVSRDNCEQGRIEAKSRKKKKTQRPRTNCSCSTFDASLLIGLLHCLSRKRHPALPCPRDVFDSITIWSDNRVNVSATLSRKKILNVFFILLYDDQYFKKRIGSNRHLFLNEFDIRQGLSRMLAKKNCRHIRVTRL